MITAIIKDVGEEIRIDKIGDTLKDMQKIVDGYIEVVKLPYNIDMWLNEEGLLLDLPLNLITLVEGKVTHQIVGNVFFASRDSGGYTTSLSEEQMNWLESRLAPIGREVDSEHTVWGLFVR